MAEDYVYKKVDSIVFGMLSPEFIKKMASTKIVTPELYDKEGYPVDGGLMDIRLGVIDPGLRCKTCGGKLKECIGHFGYMELARPVVHVKYADMILAFLRCTCRECGKLLMADKKVTEQLEEMEEIVQEGEEDLKKSGKEMRASTRNIKKCPHCSSKQLTIKIEKPTIRISFSPRYLSAIIPAGSSKKIKGSSIKLNIRPITDQLKPRF